MFVYVVVDEMPPGAVEWQAHAKEVLRRSRPALDLSEAEECAICQADNGNWKLETVFHYCLSNGRASPEPPRHRFSLKY